MPPALESELSSNIFDFLYQRSTEQTVSADQTLVVRDKQARAEFVFFFENQRSRGGGDD